GKPSLSSRCQTNLYLRYASNSPSQVLPPIPVENLSLIAYSKATREFILSAPKRCEWRFGVFQNLLATDTSKIPFFRVSTECPKEILVALKVAMVYCGLSCRSSSKISNKPLWA